MSSTRAVDIALYQAAASGDLDALRKAIDAGARLNARVWPVGSTALGAASSEGHLAIVRGLLEAGAKVDAPDDLGRTPLALAAREDKVDVLTELLNAGADIEAVTDAGETVLMEAARWGNLDATRTLIAAGADVNRVVDGVTAYDHATQRTEPGHRAVAELLRSGGGGTAIAGAKALAQGIARSFGVRVRRGGSSGFPGWPATHFGMKATHRGMQIEIEVFDGGCTVTGPVAARPVQLALNRPLPGVETRVRSAPDVPVPLFCRARTETDRVHEFVLDPERLRIVTRLELSGDELFGVDAHRFYLLHHSRDLAALRTRLGLLAELLPKPRPVRVVAETAHRIKIGKPIPEGRRERARHWFGGELDRPTKCRNCKTPAHLLLTIDPTDEALGVRSLGREPLRVVFCLDCMLFPSLTYIDFSTAHPQIVRQDPGERHDETTPLERCVVQLVRQTSPKGPGSKVGGWPKWIQEPDVPECIGCREPMAFLAQIASTPTLSFVDDGTLYAFVCEKCRIMASLVQSR
jgi:uncharacterized protein